VARAVGILKGGATFAWIGQMPVTASDSVISLRDDAGADAAAQVQDRHTGAKTPQTPVAGHTSRAPTLGTRLALSIHLPLSSVPRASAA